MLSEIILTSCIFLPEAENINNKVCALVNKICGGVPYPLIAATLACTFSSAPIAFTGFTVLPIIGFAVLPTIGFAVLPVVDKAIRLYIKKESFVNTLDKERRARFIRIACKLTIVTASLFPLLATPVSSWARPWRIFRTLCLLEVVLLELIPYEIGHAFAIALAFMPTEMVMKPLRLIKVREHQAEAFLQNPDNI